MPLNFPDSPTLNEIYTSGSNSWQWDGTVWNALSSSSVGPAGSMGVTGATGPAGSGASEAFVIAMAIAL